MKTLKWVMMQWREEKKIKQQQQKTSMLLLVKGNSTEHWKEKCSIFSYRIYVVCFGIYKVACLHVSLYAKQNMEEIRVLRGVTLLLVMDSVWTLFHALS